MVFFDRNYDDNKTGEDSMGSRMTCFWRPAFVSTLVVFSSASQALTPSQVFEVVKDSVIVVRVLDSNGKEIAMGSGVMLPSGKIATNCHVIKDGQGFQVGRSKQFVNATIYAGDGDKDICLLDGKDIGGKPATLGNSASLKVGDAVYAVGAPRGLELSLSDGIVSQLRGSSPPIIQTTAAISPGSSGGGLFDSKARLVGFTTLYIDGGQSLNFAMPVEWLAGIRPGKITTSKQRSQIDWITRAAALEVKQDWSGLLDWGKLWVKAGAEYSLAWFFIGAANQKLDQFDQAIVAYRQGLRIDPENAVVWYNLGNIYGRLDRYDDAIAAHRQAVLINPEYADAWGVLAVDYAMSGNSVAALQAIKTLRTLDPAKAETLLNMIILR